MADTAAPASGLPSAEEVSSWNNAQVCAFLSKIGLSALVPKFKENEVLGEDLVSLTPSEIKADLGITKMQAKRIKRALEGGGDGTDLATDALTQEARALSVNATEPPKVDTSHDDGEFTIYAAIQSMSGVRRPTGAPAAAAPAVAAGVVTGTPAPTQVVYVDAQLVDTWVRKTTLIAKLESEQVSSKLPAAQERLAYFKNRLAEERRKFNELKEVNEKLTKKYTELEEGSWYPGKYLMGKHRRDKKLNEAERNADESARKLEAAGKVLEDLATKLQQQQQLVNELSGKVSSLIEAKNWEANALATAFQGAAGDARENQLEAEVAALVPQVEQTRRYKVSYSKAYEHIRAARKQLEGSVQLFQSAFGLANIDVMQNFIRPAPFRNSPGGLMVDVAKRAQTRQAQQLVEIATVSLERAREIIPDMPRVKMADVRNLRGLGIFGLVFDNMVSDLIARRSLQEALGKINAVLQDVIFVERWLEGWLNGRIDQDLRALEGAYAAKKRELDDCRRALLQQQAAAMNAAFAAQSAPAAGAPAPAAPPAAPGPAPQYPTVGRAADTPSLI